MTVIYDKMCVNKEVLFGLCLFIHILMKFLLQQILGRIALFIIIDIEVNSTVI